MKKPDWPEISRLANELSAATAQVRESLIYDDHEAGLLKPAETQCKELGLALNKVLELPVGTIDPETKTTVKNSFEAVLELRGHLTVLINIADRLADNPSKGRSRLEMDWFKRSPEAIAVSRSTAETLDSLVGIIRLQAQEEEGDDERGTA